eukprot:m.141912 g.141912  ORF g.141912 m.141912 type:complete len:60 (-) comp14045_c0_seq1:1782-1961(-)
MWISFEYVLQCRQKLHGPSLRRNEKAPVSSHSSNNCARTNPNCFSRTLNATCPSKETNT